MQTWRERYQTVRPKRPKRPIPGQYLRQYMQSHTCASQRRLEALRRVRLPWD